MNIVLAGVGGQGTILTSAILAAGLAKLGYDVKMSEIHGMSQRGGSVTTHIRYGDRVFSPNVGEGEADAVVAFEKAEAVRGLPYLRRGGALIVDDREIWPLAVLTGAVQYPDTILDELRNAVENTLVLNATEIAACLGNSRAQNMVMLGALVAHLGLGEPGWKELIAGRVPPKAVGVNQSAFCRGYELALSHTTGV